MIASQTSEIYRALVASDSQLPRSFLRLPDYRAIKFLDLASQSYIAKYVESEELKTKVMDYIRKAFIENGRSIATDRKEMDAFISTFGDLLGNDRAKIRQIVNTTVSRSRVFGQLNNMRQAHVQTFEIAGPDDLKTCEFCRNMIGRVFTLSSSLSRLDSLTQSQDYESFMPFLKGKISYEDLQNSSDAELQALGYEVPPFHPECRHRTVFKDFYAENETPAYSVE